MVFTGDFTSFSLAFHRFPQQFRALDVSSEALPEDGAAFAPGGAQRLGARGAPGGGEGLRHHRAGHAGLQPKALPAA